MKFPFTALSGFGKIAFLFKSLFLILFFGYLLINAGIVSYQAKDLSVGLKEIGEEMLNPIESASDYAQDFEKANLWAIWGFYFHIYKIFLWLWIIKIIVNLFLGGTNTPVTIWGWSVLIFILIQIAYLGVIGSDVNLLWKAWLNIGKGLVRLFQDFDLGVKMLQPNLNTCNESVCVI